MSSQGSPTLDLDVRSRRIEPLLAMGILSLAIFAPLLLQVDRWMQVGLIVVSAIVVAAGFWQAGWWGSRRLQRIIWLSDGRWLLSNGHGLPVEAALLPDTRRGPGCVWLHWQRELLPGIGHDALARFGLRSRYAMLLGIGDLPAAQLRRLRVRLAVAPMGPRPPAWLEEFNEVADTLGGSLRFGEYLMRFRVWRALIRRCSSAPTRCAGVVGASQDGRAVVAGQAARHP